MKRLILFSVVVSLSFSVFAQHEHHRMAVKDTSNPEVHSMQHDMPMSHAFSLHLPMNRNGSGTGWLPDSSPMSFQLYLRLYPELM